MQEPPRRARHVCGIAAHLFQLASGESVRASVFSAAGAADAPPTQLWRSDAVRSGTPARFSRQ